MVNKCASSHRNLETLQICEMREILDLAYSVLAQIEVFEGAETVEAFDPRNHVVRQLEARQTDEISET